MGGWAALPGELPSPAGNPRPDGPRVLHQNNSHAYQSLTNMSHSASWFPSILLLPHQVAHKSKLRLPLAWKRCGIIPSCRRPRPPGGKQPLRPHSGLVLPSGISLTHSQEREKSQIERTLAAQPGNERRPEPHGPASRHSILSCELLPPWASASQTCREEGRQKWPTWATKRTKT